jgi:hypothetical protein
MMPFYFRVAAHLAFLNLHFPCPFWMQLFPFDFEVETKTILRRFAAIGFQSDNVKRETLGQVYR